VRRQLRPEIGVAPLIASCPRSKGGHTVDDVAAVAYQIDAAVDDPHRCKGRRDLRTLGRLLPTHWPAERAAPAPDRNHVHAPCRSRQQGVGWVDASTVAVYGLPGAIADLLLNPRQLRVVARRLLRKRLQLCARRRDASEGKAGRQLAAQLSGSTVGP
jgi:hypothetical protein